MNAAPRQIVILDAGYVSYQFEMDIFENAGYSLLIYDGDPDDLKAKTAFAANAAGVLVRGTKIDEAFFRRTPHLKALVRYGVGYDNVDISAATAFGVRVANVQGYGNHSVSDHALALIYASVRGLGTSPCSFSETFSKPPRNDIFELHDKILGIVGLGRIGSHLAQKAENLFGHIIAVDPYKSADYFTALHVGRVDLDSLLQQSHVISIHCNLTRETRHLMDHQAFSQMQNRPVLVNTARGPVVDSKALLQALDSDQIHSAALDVFETEPPGALEVSLANHPKVLTTGHCAWYSDEASRQLQRRAANNLLGLLKGEDVEDLLNP
ncbi:C-terminal binding protein [Planctomycetota bacterium]